MKQLIENFPVQLQEALQIGKQAKFTIPQKSFRQVLVSGLGGSGIGATIVQEYVSQQLKIPFLVNKDYSIPKCVNEETLFIACSYSGNTEETIMAVLQAKKAGAFIVCVSSGGQLLELANKHHWLSIQIPGGMPPRACLGYSLIQLLFVLKSAGLIKGGFEKEIESAIERVQSESKQMEKKGKFLAEKMIGKEIAIYATSGHEGLAIRFRQQINENSKALGWSSVLPEMTHNEIVGWKAAHPNLMVVFCYHPNDFPKNLKRMKILQKVVKTYSPNHVEIVLKGESYWEKAFTFIHLTDWVSYHLALLGKNDPVEVKVIDYLKKEMSKK